MTVPDFIYRCECCGYVDEDEAAPSPRCHCHNGYVCMFIRVPALPALMNRLLTISRDLEKIESRIPF